MHNAPIIQPLAWFAAGMGALWSISALAMLFWIPACAFYCLVIALPWWALLHQCRSTQPRTYPP